MNKDAIGYGFAPSIVGQAAYTVPQFCAGHNISRAHLYDLIKEGLGPRIMKVGRRTLISAEAAADWRKQMESPSAPDIAEVDSLVTSSTITRSEGRTVHRMGR